MSELKQLKRTDFECMAEEILEFLKPKGLAVGQVKEILRIAAIQADWTIMK
jgi:hypothetical protein